MKMQRREFLAGAAAGASQLLLGAPWALAQEAKSKNYDPYEMVPLGKTKIMVTRVGLGTGMRGGNRDSNHARLGKEKFGALIRACYERGIRLYDLADLYGTNPFLVPALKDIPRWKYAIANKIWFREGGIPEKERPPADVVIQRFLKEVKTDYLDLVLLHCTTSKKWPEELQDYMNAMAKMKKKGIIRAHGVSCHSLDALKAAAVEPWVDSIHARINAYGNYMDGKPEEVASVLKLARKNGKAVVGMKVVGQGDFGDSDEKKDTSIKFVLEQGLVDAMVVGFEKIPHIDDFAKRVRKVPRQKPKKMALL